MSEKSTYVPTTIYADFADPRSYLASLRADALLAEGHTSLRWKSVQHRPTLPPSGVRLDGSAHAIRAVELRQACEKLGLKEHCDARNPAFLPNTAVASAVHATAVELGAGAEVRRVLLDAYWIRGLDIGNTEVVRHIIKPVLERISPGGITKEQYLRLQISAGHVARTWQQEWLSMGTPVQLTVVTPRRNAEYGIDALSRLCVPHQFAA
jgi:2-hydroxychromene-2-carboxylate isomerase